jgi:pimeloyl-ACP methyl ester carboxylesterase
MMIHGWSSHLHIWESAFEAFSGAFDCVAIELLGFGESDKPQNGNYCIDAQAALVLKIADALGIDKFIPVGHSMGAQIAYYIASELAPARIPKIINISGVVMGQLSDWVRYVVIPMSWLGFYFPLFYGLLRFFSRFQWFAHLEYRVWFYDWRKLDWGVWQIDRDMTNQVGIHVGNFKAGQAMRRMDMRQRLSRITVPQVVIFGRQDGLVPPRDGLLAAELIPQTRLVWLDECGHFPMREQNAAYLAAMRDFLGA